MEYVRTSHLLNSYSNNKQEAAYHQSNRLLLPTAAAFSQLAQLVVQLAVLTGEVLLFTLLTSDSKSGLAG